MAAITISTHNGSTVSLSHNIREPSMVANENRKWAEKHPGELRIDPDGEYEILHYEPLQEAYENIFGEALREWNEKQEHVGKFDRMIPNYLSHIKSKENDSKNAKHPVYEMILAVGNRDNPVDKTIAEKILREAEASWIKRNTALHVVCSVLHMDESGVPHIHISYIPIAENCKRGLRTQNSLSKALEQMGFKGESYFETPQILWEKRENEALEAICRKYGYEVVHPERGTNVEHLTVEEFKLTKDINTKQEQLNQITALPAGKILISKGRLEQLEKIEAKSIKDAEMLAVAGREASAAKKAVEAYVEASASLEKDRSELTNLINEEANKKIHMMNKDAIDFITQAGLSEEYKAFTQLHMVQHCT